uniref:Uncharacterized protein n=1 Tax=Rhizophora mucronata TaxID=61149 RepID=A0A2P2J063_RHIMU
MNSMIITLFCIILDLLNYNGWVVLLGRQNSSSSKQVMMERTTIFTAFNFLILGQFDWKEVLKFFIFKSPFLRYFFFISNFSEGSSRGLLSMAFWPFKK